MSRVLEAIVLGMVVTLVVGCAPAVQPHVRSSDFLVTGQKTNGKIDLYVSESFRSYKAEKTDISELKNWQFELGTAAVDAFRFGLESRFSDVSVQLGSPQFPTDGGDGFYAAVQPTFTQFEASDPILFKFENYKATVGFNVTVHSKGGEAIHSQTYVGEGTEQGSIGFSDPGHAAYPVATQKAIKSAVERFVNDLVGLSNRSDMIDNDAVERTR